MSRLSLLSNPLLLGFDEIERLVDRASKGANDGYPPYNVARIGAHNGTAELLRISLAVAGFTRDQLDITLEDRQLTIRGKQQEDKGREFLYRGIAARQFTRTFVLAEGIEVRSANLANGLLAIDLERLESSIRDINPTDMEQLRAALSGDIFLGAPNESQQRALDRLETMLALVEGWVEEVTARAVARTCPMPSPCAR